MPDHIHRLRLVKPIAIIGFLAGVLLSPSLWLTERFFPMIPPIGSHPLLPPVLDLIFVVLFITLLLAWIFIDDRRVGAGAIAILLIALLQDILRLQPWVYLYFLILLVLLFYEKSKNPKEILICLQLIIAGLYFWSGVSKINANFRDITFINILTTAGLPPGWKWLAYIAAVIEASSGVALLIPKIRKVAVIATTIIPLFILAYLGPLGRNENSVVYPWNIVMICLIWILFWDVPESTINIRKLKITVKQSIVMLIVWMLPVLNFFSLFDHFLSFSLYSDRPSAFYIAVEKSKIEKIDRRLHRYFVQLDGITGGELIDVNRWALGELNVTFYPETRVFRKFAVRFCDKEISSTGIVFVELSRVDGINHFATYSCIDL